MCAGDSWVGSEIELPESKGYSIFLFFKDFIYLFMREREREREAETHAEGEAGSMQGG